MARVNAFRLALLAMLGLSSPGFAAPNIGKVTDLAPILVTKHRTVESAGVYTMQTAEVMTAAGPTVLAWTCLECTTSTLPPSYPHSTCSTH